jgi:hypothetical protein
MNPRSGMHLTPSLADAAQAKLIGQSRRPSARLRLQPPPKEACFPKSSIETPGKNT